MTFPRIKPAGWSTNETLTSQQISQLDIDHASAVDKTGDTVTGTISVASGASIAVASGGQVSVASGGQIVAAAGSTATFSGALALRAGEVLAGGSLTLDDSLPLIASGSPFRSRKVTGFLNGINADIAPWGTGRTTSQTVPYIYVTGSPVATPVFLQLAAVHHGATLSRLDILVQNNLTRTALPQFLPAIDILRFDTMSAGAAPSFVSLSSLGAQSPTPATPAAYYNSAQIQTFSYFPDQNNVIDTTRYYYAIKLASEYGTNSQGGVFYFSQSVTFTNIASMTFP